MNRFRRLRTSKQLRTLVQETRISKEELIYPIFVIEGRDVKNPIPSMPGIFQYSIDRICEELDRILQAGIGSILVFGIPEHKDACGSEAYAELGITQRAIRHIKEYAPELIVIADVCLCEYTDHGHCGLIEQGEILNDETLPLLAQMAVSLVKAGADMVAPSDMMDFDVKAIREALDKEGFLHTPIMAYSAKFASAYYGPFREAAHSAPSFGDRKSYQMDIANRKEARRALQESVEEGADIIMVKPALAYLDIIREAADSFLQPLAVYNVSGEYSMVKAAAEKGWIEEKRIVLENMTALKRAGANMIITYHALDVAGWLSEEA